MRSLKIIYNEGHSELLVLLKNHDWYYDYSDDAMAWHRGNKTEKKIHELIKVLGESGIQLYNDHAPTNYRL